jgi:glycosyltransferase involved in cell wall biosynthesis
LIYICIPAFDEASTVGVLLWRIRQVMGEFPRDYEILVLDDGSTDDTEDVLAPYARVLPLTVLRHEQRQGYAASLERLIREAVDRATHPRRDVVVTLQADFTEAPEDIPALVKRIEGGADVVEATVGVEDDDMPRALRWSRKGLPWLLRRAPLPEGIRDPLSGFRAYRIAVLKKALAERNGSPLLSREGWAANVELLLAVAPYTRRADATETATRRYDRRQRETRFRPWDTLVDLWDVSRRARRMPPALTSSDATG